MRSPVYLDNNATTRLDERALAAMLPYLKDEYGNASSASHAYGWSAEAAVEVARERVAAAVGALPEEVFFTSGATESDNLALRGLLAPGDHLIVSAVEHEAVLKTARLLEGCGVALTVLPVGRDGRVSPEELRRSLREDTALVSVMLANNETGAINDVRVLARVAAERGVPFHTDAAQALGRIDLDLGDLGVSLASLSAHKAHGPKGVGALYVRQAPPEGVRTVALAPLLTGGSQERGLRSGTLNVPAIVGFGVAASLAAEELPKDAPRLARLRERLLARLREGFEPLGLPVRLNGNQETTLPNTLSITLGAPDSGAGYLDAGELLAACPSVAASTGSACASRSSEVSHVLAALGMDREEATATLRLGLGRFTTEEEVDLAARRLAEAARDLVGARSARTGPRRDQTNFL